MFHIFQLSFSTILYNITCEIWRIYSGRLWLSTCSIFLTWYLYDGTIWDN